MTDVEIRRIGAADDHLLANVAEDVFDAPIDVAFLAAYLAAPGHMMVLAVCAGQVIGQARGMVHLSPDQAPELYIDNMGVTPARLREGIGGRLLDALRQWGHEAGCDYAWLGTEADNVAAQALYESRGGARSQMVMYEYDDGAGIISQ